jgi:hypothetical protein
MPFLAWRTLRYLAWRAVGAALEPGVAKAAVAGFCNHHTLPVIGKITDDFMGIDIVHDGAAGHDYIEILARFSGLVSAGTGLPVAGFEIPCNPKIGKRINAVIGKQVDVTPIAAVAAVRTTSLNEFFTPKAQAAVSPVAGLHTDCGFIDEFHVLLFDCYE